MDRYRAKRTLLRPLTAWRRHRAREEKPFNRAVFEAHDYRPSMRRFFAATRANPDILIDVALPEGAVVLDVGAFEGEWTSRMLHRADEVGPQAITVHAFEPQPSALRRLDESIARDPRVHLHRFGLAGTDRTEVLAMAGPGSSVYLDPDAPEMLGRASIELRDVGAVLDELAVPRIDLVKINIEGGEYELIDRLHETGWLARTDTLIVQFHEFAPDAYRARRRNQRQLAELHRRSWSYSWVYERWDRQLSLSGTRG